MTERVDPDDPWDGDDGSELDVRDFGWPGRW